MGIRGFEAVIRLRRCSCCSENDFVTSWLHCTSLEKKPLLTSFQNQLNIMRWRKKLHKHWFRRYWHFKKRCNLIFSVLVSYGILGGKERERHLVEVFSVYPWRKKSRIELKFCVCYFTYKSQGPSELTSGSLHYVFHGYDIALCISSVSHSTSVN